MAWGKKKKPAGRIPRASPGVGQYLVAAGNPDHFHTGNLSADFVGNGVGFHGAGGFWNLIHLFFLHQFAGGYRNLAASLFGNHLAALALDNFLMGFRNHLADGVGDFADTVLLSHDAFLAGNHFALFLANHPADGVGNLANFVFTDHLAALAGYAEVFHFGHHAAFGEGYLLASDFRNHLAAVGANHIAVFLANIFGAANLAHFGAWFPYFLADGSVGKLDRAAGYMTWHEFHTA